MIGSRRCWSRGVWWLVMPVLARTRRSYRVFEEAREKKTPGIKAGGRPLQIQNQHLRQGVRDVDIVLTSYQVRTQKPDPLIWDVALRTARRLSLNSAAVAGSGAGEGDDGDWDFVHVGDDYGKDDRGSVNAGWKTYLPRDAEAAAKAPDGTRTITSFLDLLPELVKYR